MMKTTPIAISLVATFALVACSDTSTVNEVVSGSLAVQPRLTTLKSEAAFFDALKDALANQVGGRYAIALPLEESADLTVTTGSAAPEAASDSDSSATNEVTSTNIQEAGVDEQDRVKLSEDGSELFVLHNDVSYIGVPLGESEIISEPDIISEAADSSIFAPQAAQTSLRILSLDSETPDATSINELTVDLDGRIGDGLYLYEQADKSSVIITASGGGYWGYWDDSFAFSGLQSTIAKVDVSDAANAALSDSFIIDGQIISSRRIGDSLFFVSRYYPTVPGPQPWELTSDEWQATLEATDLSELMPEYARNGSDQTTPLVDPSECFVAPGVTDQPYNSPDIITLGVIDLDSMQLRDSECFMGATETLYATPTSVYLATTQYDYSSGPTTSSGEIVDTDVDVFESDLVWFDPRTSTDIHQFSIDDDQLSYAGSGSVPGHLGWNELQKPFRMSGSGGYLRVATMNDQQGPDHSPILFNILEADGEGELRVVSSLPNEEHPEHIGKPGEQLYASRIIGDRGYLMTFRQTDPLYVLDLSDPANPEVTGELEIDGYSDYLQPIGEDHLLGIGKDAVPASDDRGDGRGAWVQGIKLSLFDVSDPGSPTEVDSVLLGERGTDSVALRNHRAITIQAATDQHPTRVSFGASIYGNAQPSGSPSADQANRYTDFNYTGLHGFDITVGANAAITARGAMVIENSDDYYGYGDDRSVMVNDAVFYIHGKSVRAALWDNLDAQSPPR